MSNLTRIKYKDNNLFFIGVNHDTEFSKTINDSILKYSIDNNSCILIEVDSRLSTNKIYNLKSTYEKSTDLLINNIKNMNTTNKLCLKGWDQRPSILTYNNENYQQALYGDDEYKKSFLTYLTMNDIYTIFVNKIPNKSILINDNEKNKYENKIFNYLNKSFYNINKEKYEKNIFNEFYFKLGGESVYKSNRLIKDIIVNQEQVNIFEKLKRNLQDDFANISDLLLLKNIFNKDNLDNYIIILGMKHYDNIKKYLKNLNLL